MFIPSHIFGNNPKNIRENRIKEKNSINVNESLINKMNVDILADSSNNVNKIVDNSNEIEENSNRFDSIEEAEEALKDAVRNLF